MSEASDARREAVLARLLSLHPRVIDLALGRLLRLLDALGRPQDKVPPVIHVAGTNGKGSTLAFTRGILEAAGARVHVYTSPHLVRFNERIRLAGRLVDDDMLIAALEECERVNAGEPITFFEITTAAAFLLFSREPADWLLLETGLGGRFDATNVVDRPAATIITSVSHDHAEFLGTDLAGIAREKAGIFKKDSPAIVAEQRSEIRDVLEREARRAGAPLRMAGRDFEAHEEQGRFVFEDERSLIDLPLPKLQGRHQHRNAAAAIAALRWVAPDLPVSAYEKGLVGARWPARLQRLTAGPLVANAPRGSEVWLDGGHNADGGRALAAAMGEIEEIAPAPLVLVCGTLANKDTAGFLAPFHGLASLVVAVPVTGEHQARAPKDIADIAALQGIDSGTAGDVADALRRIAVLRWSKPPRILITGSLYLAGEALKANGTRID
jgi:dihydrofolate synthase/folylpolyglutamate synthase